MSHTYDVVDTVNLKSCLKDLRWFVKNYPEISSWDSYVRIQVPTERSMFDVELGLCTNILDANDVRGDEYLWDGWLPYTGNECYPVGGEVEYEDSEHLYRTQDRLSLARHCISKIEAELRSRGDVC